MAAFHEVRFPEVISKGSAGGPSRRTDIVTLVSGFEERNAAQQHSRRRYDAALGVRDLDDLNAIIDFWEARYGQLYGFRWKDWSEYKSCRPTRARQPTDQPVATGDGETTVFQLTKTYASGPTAYVRPIRKPVAGTLAIAIDAVPVLSGWSVDTTTGLVTFAAAPADGAAITAGYEFDVPVRFEADQLSISLTNFRLGSLPSIDIVEIRT